jgi:DNA repair exonuclease SbcCD ATPase subunit
MTTKTKEKVSIPAKASVRVMWEDTPENYTKDRVKRIEQYIAEKYNVSKVQVIFKPKKQDTEHGQVEMSIADNVMDTTYQRKLFKEWLEGSKIDVDWDRLLRLDDKVNDKLKQIRDIEYRYRNWYIKELEWDNFLSYGDGNKLSFDGLRGITTISSNPANQGGKTALSVDLLLFLFFNETTRTKVAAQVFNKFRDVNTVRVKGKINIDGGDYIIERTLIRTKKKTEEGYNVKTDLNFQKVMADGTTQNLEGEQRRETDEFIRKSIGDVDDFLLTIIATSDNLEDLIHTLPTQKGKLLSKFIGLEVIEQKEEIVKELKSAWAKNLKSDQYNSGDLTKEINDLGVKIKDLNDDNNFCNTKLDELKVDITETNSIKDTLLSQKITIDTEIIRLRPEDIDREIETITEKSKKSKEKYDILKEEFDKLTEIEYDSQTHKEWKQQLGDLNIARSHKSIKKDAVQDLIKNLEEGEFCSLCKQPLKDVDHSDEINSNKLTLEELIKNIKDLDVEIEEAKKEIEKLDKIKEQVDDYDRKSIMIDKIGLEMENLRLQLKEKKDLKKKYEDNIGNIEKNKDLDSKILGYNAKLDRLNRERDGYLSRIQRNKSDVERAEDTITKNKELIKTIKIEEEVKIIFEIYIRMVGKNGITKLIMKNVMPLLNSELERLLSDSSNFKLTVDINAKQEVDFILEKEDENGQTISYLLTEGSGFEKTIGSLALRVVLSRISSLPKPNIIVFDEVLGKVANENLELVGNFFQKCSEMFDNIFLITHNPLVKDWSNNVITIEKINNVSSLTMSK